MADDLAGFGRRIDGIADAVTGRALAPILKRVGVKAKGDFVEAVRSDIGDNSLSNWWRGRPIPITARFDLVEETAVEVSPTPRSKGPTTVLQRGRQAGVSKGRRGRQPRSYGASAGKGTWSDAVGLMQKRTPERVHDELGKVLRKHMTGA